MDNKQKNIALFCTLCCSFIMLATKVAHAAPLALESRLGGQAYYDPNLNITWAADPELLSPETWANQTTRAANVSIGGVTGWRLPDADVNGDRNTIICSSAGVAGCIDNEMAYLFWEEGITSDAPGPFGNLQPDAYWSSTIFEPFPADIWAFNFTAGSGNPLVEVRFASRRAWLVHSGDVGVVPIPAAAWLFGSGLTGLLVVARRRCRGSSE